MLWGQSLPFWQTAVFWLWAIAAVGGGVAVTASFGSSILSYYISSETERQANLATQAANAQGVEANNRSKELDLRLQQARTDFERERAERLRLEERIAPRLLSEAQKQAIAKSLSDATAPAEIIVYSEGDPEAAFFADQIAQAFSSGTTISRHEQSTFIGVQAPGMIAIRNDPDGSVRRALTAAGLAFEGVGRDDSEPSSIIVGPKPIKAPRQ